MKTKTDQAISKIVDLADLYYSQGYDYSDCVAVGACAVREGRDFEVAIEEWRADASKRETVGEEVWESRRVDFESLVCFKHPWYRGDGRGLILSCKACTAILLAKLAATPPPATIRREFGEGLARRLIQMADKEIIFRRVYSSID